MSIVRLRALDANPEQWDLDSDGLGDACGPDIDGDGVENGGDLCAATPQDALVSEAAQSECGNKN